MAPNMLPWSVSATAFIPPAATRLTRSFTFTAPSSSEYCECTWRWTNSAVIARYANVGTGDALGTQERGRESEPPGRRRTPGFVGRDTLRRTHLAFFGVLAVLSSHSLRCWMCWRTRV